MTLSHHDPIGVRAPNELFAKYRLHCLGLCHAVNSILKYRLPATFVMKIIFCSPVMKLKYRIRSKVYSSYHTSAQKPLGHIKIFLFPVPAQITFGERIMKNFIFHFIKFDVSGTTINCFSVKADPFCPLFYWNYVSIGFCDLCLW